jgi:leader peptidase (prepilin peptidase)/N-methyltransferase
VSRGPLISGSLGATLLGALSASHHAAPLVTLRLATAGAALGAIAWIDAHEHRIPNRLVLPAAALSGVLIAITGVPSDVPGGLAVAAALLVIAIATPSAVGMGDVKLAVLISVALPPNAIAALLLGFALATAGALVLILANGRGAMRRSIALAPYLAGGSALAVAAWT